MNFWGYSSINFFSPMTRYAAAGIRNCGRDAINEFKTLVREAHKLGIEASNSQIMLLHEGYVSELFHLCLCIATIVLPHSNVPLQRNHSSYLNCKELALMMYGGIAIIGIAIVVYDILIYTNISAGFYGCCVQSYRRRQ